MTAGSFYRGNGKLCLELPTHGSADAEVVLIGTDWRFAVEVFVDMKTPVEV